MNIVNWTTARVAPSVRHNITIMQNDDEMTKNTDNDVGFWLLARWYNNLRVFCENA